MPEGPVAEIPTPSPTLAFTQEELRQELVKSSSANSQISRYTEVLATDNSMGNFKTPSQLSPPLPFDSIILIFVFIFPLYFTSQFFMMSIMNERIERKGEILLSTPVKASSIILGKMLPYFLGMLAICTGLTFWIKAPLIIILPLIPVIFFFLANALLIGMLSRSFKELSFISIFFSTVATSYLFFPSIFANVHVISLISPLTLIVFELQGTAWTVTDYLYSTSLFWLTSAVLFYVAAKNFKEERLFSEKNLVTRMREFLSEVLSQKRPFLSLFLLAGFSIPFVFMVQLMCLVLFFNLPMPYSLVLLLMFAALIEEIAKGIGIYTIYARDAVVLYVEKSRARLRCNRDRFPRGGETAPVRHPCPDHGIGLWQHPLPLARRALDAAPPAFRRGADRCLLPETGGQGLVCTGTCPRHGRALSL